MKSGLLRRDKTSNVCFPDVCNFVIAGWHRGCTERKPPTCDAQAGVGARSLYETPVELTPETHRTATKGLDGWGGLSSLLPALRDANLS